MPSCQLLSFIIIGGSCGTFSQLILEVMRHLEGAYALIFKSKHFPNELVACKRGSPLLLGVKVSCMWDLFARHVLHITYRITAKIFNYYFTFSIKIVSL